MPSCAACGSAVDGQFCAKCEAGLARRRPPHPALFRALIYIILQTYRCKAIVLPVIGPTAQQQAGN
jgi:hypothetical protein